VTPDVLPAAGFPPVPALPPKLVEPETPDVVAPPGVVPEGMLPAAAGAAGAGAGVDEVVGAGGGGAGAAGAAEPIAAEAPTDTAKAATASEPATTGLLVKVLMICFSAMLFLQCCTSSGQLRGDLSSQTRSHLADQATAEYWASVLLTALAFRIPTLLWTSSAYGGQTLILAADRASCRLVSRFSPNVHLMYEQSAHPCVRPERLLHTGCEIARMTSYLVVRP
jgi:hypothetical protein